MKGSAKAALAAALLVVFMVTAASSVSVDVGSANLQSWRIATAGEPWLEDVDLDELGYETSTQGIWLGTNSDGHLVVYRSPGAVAGAVPAYLLAAESPAAFSVLPASLLAALLTWLSVLLLWGAVRPRLGEAWATIAAGVLALGTPVWSVAADSFWPHTLTVLGIAGMAWAASRDRWLLVGILGGVGLCGRLHLAVAVAVVGVAMGLARRDARVTALVAAGSLPFVGLCAAWSRWLYGQWDPAGGYSQVDAYASRAVAREADMQLLNPLGLLLSPDRGLLVWTPVLLVLGLACIRSWRHQPDWSRALFLAGVTYTIVQNFMNVFHGGDNFYGYRLMLEILVCSFPLLAHSICWTGSRARRYAGGVTALMVGMIALGAVTDSPGIGQDVVWTSNAFVIELQQRPWLLPLWLLVGCAGVIAGRVVGARWGPPSRVIPAEGASSRDGVEEPSR